MHKKCELAFSEGCAFDLTVIDLESHPVAARKATMTTRCARNVSQRRAGFPSLFYSMIFIGNLDTLELNHKYYMSHDTTLYLQIINRAPRLLSPDAQLRARRTEERGTRIGTDATRREMPQC